MTSVKRRDDDHVAVLMGRVFDALRAAMPAEEWDGLRQSHLRVLTSVPLEGISITDLGERVRMTKQGCGQFVGRLEGTGHLRVDPDPADRRVRRVSRTPRGDRAVADATAHILDLERQWAEQVGERRYRTFRAVLGELAANAGDAAAG